MPRTRENGGRGKNNVLSLTGDGRGREKINGLLLTALL